MRTLLTKKNSTLAERRFAEVLKEFRIPFRFRVKINGYEVDFLIGRYAIEIDGHPQASEKNHLLAKEGYVPLHFTNKDVSNTKLIKQCLEQISPRR